MEEAEIAEGPPLITSGYQEGHTCIQLQTGGVSTKLDVQFKSIKAPILKF